MQQRSKPIEEPEDTNMHRLLARDKDGDGNRDEDYNEDGDRDVYDVLILL